MIPFVFIDYIIRLKQYLWIFQIHLSCAVLDLVLTRFHPLLVFVSSWTQKTLKVLVSSWSQQTLALVSTWFRWSSLSVAILVVYQYKQNKEVSGECEWCVHAKCYAMRMVIRVLLCSCECVLFGWAIQILLGSILEFLFFFLQ